MPRRPIYWQRDERGRFVPRSRPAEQPEQHAHTPTADAGAGRNSDRPPQPASMDDIIRAHFLGGEPADWARERERSK